MAAPQHPRRRTGRLLSAGLALAVAGGFTLTGCAQVGQKAKEAANSTSQAALAPAVNPVLDLLRQGQSQLEAGNLTAVMATMGGFEGLWSKAAPVIQPLAGDRWPAIETAADRLRDTFAGAEPTADEAKSAIGNLLGPLSSLVGQ